MKYEVRVVTKQRYVIVVDATDKETAVRGTLDLIDEEPDNTNAFDKFILGPEVEVKEIKEDE
jgi:hypothetical protein